jgi:serine/threonine protein phosphatase PrpC
MSDKHYVSVVKARRPEIAAEQLVALANARGGKDNITVIVAGVGGELDAAVAAEPLEDAVQVIEAYRGTTGPVQA